jgi:hypothetical protein
MRPGESVEFRFRRRDGSEHVATATLAASPALRIVTVEQIGGSLSDEQSAFREAWLGSRR